MCDFETTVYDGQTNTEVWAAACVELFTEDVHIFHSIGEQFEYLRSIPGNIVVYYHNLKFDGTFWLNFLSKKKDYWEAYIGIEQKFLEDEQMPNKSYS